MSTVSAVLDVPETLVFRPLSSTVATAVWSATSSNCSKKPTRRYLHSWSPLLARAPVSAVAVVVVVAVAVPVEVAVQTAMSVAWVAEAEVEATVAGLEIGVLLRADSPAAMVALLLRVATVEVPTVVEVEPTAVEATATRPAPLATPGGKHDDSRRRYPGSHFFDPPVLGCRLIPFKTETRGIHFPPFSFLHGFYDSLS
jgi:hypothetical protein